MDVQVTSTLVDREISKEGGKSEHQQELLYDVSSSPPAHITVVYAVQVTSTLVDREISKEGGESEHQQELLYDVSSSPPAHITVVYAVQLLLSNIGATLSTVYLIHANLCGGDNDVLFADLLATAVFMVGFCTLLQTTLGSRLPMYQGSARFFIPALNAVMLSKQHLCDTGSEQSGLGRDTSNQTHINGSSRGPFPGRNGSDSGTTNPEVYKLIINEVSGSLALASCVQALLGATGFIGALMSFVGPLTIAPIVALIGLGLTRSASKACQHHWGIAFLTIFLVYLFSIVMEKIKVPIPTITRKRKCRTIRSPLFKLFPQIFAMGIAWILCGILTATNYFPNDKKSSVFRARTDAKLDVLTQVSWFTVPYPGQYGAPSFTIGMTLGFMAAILPSLMDTAGDYYATARVCGLPPPPAHAVNRGIFIDGVGRVLSGLVGACHVTSSYSTPIGFITLTGVGSRLVWQVASVMIMVIGMLGKVTGCLSLVPDPIMGGMATVGLMVLVGVALSNLCFVDLNSTRNQVVLGTALMMGLMVPEYVRNNPGCIKTGSESFDQVLSILLCTGMCVGGLTACVLDNVLPGTPEERGLLAYNSVGVQEENVTEENVTEQSELPAKAVFDLPLVTGLLRKAAWTRYIPISPTFNVGCSVNIKSRLCGRRKCREDEPAAETSI